MDRRVGCRNTQRLFAGIALLSAFAAGLVGCGQRPVASFDGGKIELKSLRRATEHEKGGRLFRPSDPNQRFVIVAGEARVTKGKDLALQKSHLIAVDGTSIEPVISSEDYVANGAVETRNIELVFVAAPSAKFSELRVVGASIPLSKLEQPSPRDSVPK